MNKSTKVIIGIVAATAIGVSAYGMSGGGFFQGRITIADKSTGSYINKKFPCLTPEEYNKKYNIPSTPGTEPDTTDGTEGTPVVGTPGTPGSSGGSSSRTPGTDPKREGGTDSSNTDNGRDGGEKEDKPDIVINIGGILGNGGSGGTVNKGGSETPPKKEDDTYSSPAENEKGPQTNYVECSCARQGYKYITKDDEGKDVYNVCYVQDYMKCIPPEFKCPEGKEYDYPSLYDFCKSKKTKNCFAAKKPDTTSQDDALCKALVPAYKDGWTCVTPDDCKEYASWYKAGTLTANMIQNGVSMADTMTCSDMYNSIWYGK